MELLAVSLVFGLVGFALILLAMVDFIWTTMSLRDAGPVTRRFSCWIWSGFLTAYRASGNPGVITMAGPVILFGTLSGWILMLWLGWTLVFMSHESALMELPDMGPAGFWGRVYYSGFTISTLGIGGVAPGSSFWRVLTTIAALNGLIVITVGITYLLAVLGAVVERRQFAAHLSALGPSPEEILTRGWNGRNFDSLTSHFITLIPALLLQTEKQLAYPILHFFRAEEISRAAGPAIAKLDDTLTLLEHGVVPEKRPPDTLIRPLRAGIDRLLDNLTPSYLSPGKEAPPIPDLEPLRSAGIPVVDNATFKKTVGRLAERRRTVLAMIRNQVS